MGQPSLDDVVQGLFLADLFPPFEGDPFQGTPKRRKYGRAAVAYQPPAPKKPASTSRLFPGVDLDRPLGDQPNASIGVFALGEEGLIPGIIGGNVAGRIAVEIGKRAWPENPNLWTRSDWDAYFRDLRQRLFDEPPVGRGGGPGASAAARAKAKRKAPRKVKVANIADSRFRAGRM